MFSVELIPDAATERAVTDDWSRLAAAGLPSAGRNPSPSNRPHVTLAVRAVVDPAALVGIDDLLPLPLELGGMLLFVHPGGVVVTRQVVVTAPLLELHRAVSERLGPPEARYATSAPDRWSPHVTLARRVAPDRLAAVLETVDSRPLPGEAIGLRVWDAQERVITTLR